MCNHFPFTSPIQGRFLAKRDLECLEQKLTPDAEDVNIFNLFFKDEFAMVDNLNTDRPGQVWPAGGKMSFLRAFPLKWLTFLAICGNGIVSAGTTPEGLEWLKENSQKEGVITTSSGMALGDTGSFPWSCFFHLLRDRSSIQSYPQW